MTSCENQQYDLLKTPFILALSAYNSKTISVTPIFYYGIVISMIRCNVLQSLKKILRRGFRVTLNFRKFKVALNPLPIGWRSKCKTNYYYDTQMKTACSLSLHCTVLSLHGKTEASLLSFKSNIFHAETSFLKIIVGISVSPGRL